MRGNFGQSDLVCLVAFRKLRLGVLCLLFELLANNRISTLWLLEHHPAVFPFESNFLGQIHAEFALKLAGHPSYNLVVKVVASKPCVATYGKHPEVIPLYPQDRNVKGSTTEIVDHDRL